MLSTGNASSLLDGKSSVVDPKLLIGQRLGGYLITDYIEQGGMSRVYKGKKADASYDRIVAIKIINPSSFSYDTMAYFATEQQLLCRMNHPNICQMYDGDISDDGIPFIVMEYVEGQTLSDFSDLVTMSTSDKIDLFIKVVSAIQYAHQNYIVHRDIKPSNVLITEKNEVKLIDFGIAKVDDNLNSLKSKASPLTLSYASPEQTKGGRVSFSSDVYQLGLLMIFILTGDNILRIKDESTLEQVREGLEENAQYNVLKHFEDKSCVINYELLAMILKCLEVDVSKRYRNCDKLLEDLERFRDGGAISILSHSFLYRIKKAILRRKIVSMVSALTIVFILMGTLVYIKNINDARELERQSNEKLKSTNGVLFKILKSTNPLKTGDKEPSLSDSIIISSKEIIADDQISFSTKVSVFSALSLNLLDRGKVAEAKEIMYELVKDIEVVSSKAEALLFIEYGYVLHRSEIDNWISAKEYADKGFAFLEKKEDYEPAIWILTRMGAIYRDNEGISNIYMRKAYDKYMEWPNYKDNDFFINFIANYASMKNDWKSEDALFYINLSNEVSLNKYGEGHPRSIVPLHLKSTVYIRNSEFLKCYDSASKATKISREMNLTSLEWFTLQALSYCAFKVEDFELTKSSIERKLELDELVGRGKSDRTKYERCLLALEQITKNSSETLTDDISAKEVTVLDKNTISTLESCNDLPVY